MLICKLVRVSTLKSCNHCCRPSQSATAEYASQQQSIRKALSSFTCPDCWLEDDKSLLYSAAASSCLFAACIVKRYSEVHVAHFLCCVYLSHSENMTVIDEYQSTSWPRPGMCEASKTGIEPNTLLKLCIYLRLATGLTKASRVAYL